MTCMFENVSVCRVVHSKASSHCHSTGMSHLLAGKRQFGLTHESRGRQLSLYPGSPPKPDSSVSLRVDGCVSAAIVGKRGCCTNGVPVNQQAAS